MRTDFKIDVEERTVPVGHDTFQIQYGVKVAISPLTKDAAMQLAGVIANAINAQGFLDTPLQI